jgi:hypothetical protein
MEEVRLGAREGDSEVSGKCNMKAVQHENSQVESSRVHFSPSLGPVEGRGQRGISDAEQWDPCQRCAVSAEISRSVIHPSSPPLNPISATSAKDRLATSASASHNPLPLTTLV